MASPPPPSSQEPDATRPPAPTSLQPPSQGPAPALPRTYPSDLPASGPWLTPDPGSSSTQSLPLSFESLSPSAQSHHQHKRRKLLVIYIHGFLGNDQSFRSFPAHVHALLTNMLAESHVIHSKIYPRYKTYRAVNVARDNFSAWLAPHEGPNTDVVLVGHSMGGILAADVILMPNQSPYSRYPFQHRILGHVSVDCPFLGLHPGIIVSGISSLFKTSPTPPQDHPSDITNLNVPPSTVASPSSSSVSLTISHSSTPGSPAAPSSTTSTPSLYLPGDVFFNQPFFNDSTFRKQPFLRRILHFGSKYRSQGVMQAAAKHVLSYLEFGGCLADLAGLKLRYCRLRALEDVDELQSFGQGRGPRGPQTRVRFVNYYSLCTGRPKVPKREASQDVVAVARELDAAKPGKLRQFCKLPDSETAVMDPTWVDVFVADVDEVGAHCGLFFPGPHYEKLVGDVGSRIVGWVQEDLTKRAILEMGEDIY